MDFCNEHFHGDSFERPDLYRNADKVIADTFYGTIFSVINRKKSVDLIRKSKDCSYGNQTKLLNLLIRLGLESRSFSHGDEILSDKLLAEIDYDKVFEVIDKECKHTMEYLRENLR